jgi:hypothetical protein
MSTCDDGGTAARGVGGATGGAGRWAVGAVCGGLVYYHCAVRRASAVSLAADVLLVLLCSLSILGLLFRHLHISCVPPSPLTLPRCLFPPPYSIASSLFNFAVLLSLGA